MSIPSLYLVAKSLHLVGAFSWMAGVFYLVRIMVYHAEAATLVNEQARATLVNQYAIMEKRVYKVILMPAVVITWVFGTIMLAIQPAWFQDAWIYGKLFFILLLTVYTWYCNRHIGLLADGRSTFTHLHYRAMNEVPTILMVAIIFLGVFKSGINWGYLATGLGLFTGLIFYAVKKANAKNA